MVVALWAPMALVIPELPNLSTASQVTDFYGEHAGLMKVILACVSAGFAFFLVFLGALVARLPRSGEHGYWTWTALASALMFTTALCVALGLDAGAVLLHDRAGQETVWTLHSAAFLLAAPAAGAGVAFFAAMAALSVEENGLPHWSRWVALAAGIINLGALGGFFSLSGPLNSGNGVIGGLAGPVASWLVWILAMSCTWIVERPSSVDVVASAPQH
jgi:hypothetical protein